MITHRRLLFVSGKGGVGKTTIAAALGRLAALSGRRTLCVEMDATGGLSSLLGADGWQYKPTPTSFPDLYGMQMNTEDALREYLARYLPVPFVGRLRPLARSFDFIADAAPAVREMLSIGKICTDIRDDRWDTIVVDAEATGHAVSQLGAPRAFRDLIRVGLIDEQSDWMREMLADPETTAAVVVTTPEELAVSEAIELGERLVAEAGVAPPAAVCNRVLPTSFGRRHAAVLEQLDNCLNADARPDDPRPDDPRPDDPQTDDVALATLVGAARVIETRRQHGAAELQRLDDAGLRSILVGEYFADSADTPKPSTHLGSDPVLEHVVAELAAELDIDTGSLLGAARRDGSR